MSTADEFSTAGLCMARFVCTAQQDLDLDKRNHLQVYRSAALVHCSDQRLSACCCGRHNHRYNKEIEGGTNHNWIRLVWLFS